MMYAAPKGVYPMHSAFLRRQLMDGHRRTGELFARVPDKQRSVLADEVGLTMQHVAYCIALNRLWCWDYLAIETWWQDRGYAVPTEPEEAVYMLRSWQRSSTSTSCNVSRRH